MSSTRQPSVAVVGVGTVGAMALWQLARRGVPAVGYDALSPGHDRGAAGGESRILRAVPRRGSELVPLLQRSRQLWLELERGTGHRLLDQTGCVTVGPADHAGIRALQDTAAAHDLPLETLDGADAARRVPEHPLRDGEALVIDPNGGLLHPEASVQIAAANAEALGAKLHRYTPVVDVHDHGDFATVTTEHGQHRYDHVILAPGPWAHQFPSTPAPHVTISPVDALWFARRTAGMFSPERTPVAMRVGDPAMSCCPGVEGAKIVPRRHNKPELTSLDELPATVPADVVAQARQDVERVLPGLISEPIHAATYGEAYTADGNGLLGPIGDTNALILATAFSGHGFQLAPVLGEITADLAWTGTTSYDIAFLDPKRPRSH